MRKLKFNADRQNTLNCFILSTDQGEQAHPLAVLFPYSMSLQ